MTPARIPFYITQQGTVGDKIQPLWDAARRLASSILSPLASAAFAPLYVMLTDRYGVTWIVGADAAHTRLTVPPVGWPLAPPTPPARGQAPA